LEPSLDELVDVIDRTLTRKNGNVIIPAFAVGRTQELIYYLHHLTCTGRVRDLNIFLDSPMAQSVTKMTAAHLKLFDAEAKKLAAWRAGAPSAVMMKFTESVEESIALNAIRSGAIIIAASGMCTAGRILHHLRHGLPRSENTVLITGYQAQGTTGRALVDGASSVRIFGDEIPVNAEIVSIGGFSAHADKNAILNWLGGFKDSPQQAFITHGELEGAQALQEAIGGKLGWKVAIPGAGETVRLTS
jgi:metallo-beta-lactamase family protein